jgi:methionyl-tRNA formyltransferase
MSTFAFFGSPRFARIVLAQLLDAGYAPSVLVCNPDAPVGRKKIVTPPETKVLIEEKGVNTKVFQPSNKKEISERKEIFSDCDIAIVAAYAKIIPVDVLEMFPQGVIGVHPSLLPAHRGPSPIQQMILDANTEVGVTLYLVDEEVDHGTLLSKHHITNNKPQTYLELEEELAEKGGQLLVKTLPEYLAGNITPQAQDHSKATFTKKFSTQDGSVDIVHDNPEIVARKILALTPEPGVFTMLDGKRIKLNIVEQKEGHWVITNITPEGKAPRDVAILLPYSSSNTAL